MSAKVLEPKKKTFFRVVLPYHLEGGKLSIPKKFTDGHGKCLPNPVFLHLPNGTIWTVKSTICDDTIWFQEGWSKFAEYLSLGVGYFLMFKYEGNSHFHVTVFDKSTTEVDYPLHSGNNGDNPNVAQELKDQNKEISGSDDDSVVFLGEESTPFPKDNQDQEGTLPNVHVNHTMESKGGRKLQKMNKWERERVLKRASKAFKSKQPFFMVAIQPSFVAAKNFRLSIPCTSVEKHFDFLRTHKRLILQLRDGTVSWLVHCNVWKSKASIRAQFTAGWEAFAVDNRIEVGDVCIFLVEGSTNTLQVVIDRASPNDSNCFVSPACRGEGDTNSLNRKRSLDDHTEFNKACRRHEQFATGNASRTSKRTRVEPIFTSKDRCTTTTRSHSSLESFAALLAAQKFISKIENPYFMVSIGMNHLLNVTQPSIPTGFIKTNISENVRLEVGNKSWNVSVMNKTKSCIAICGGWIVFARANNLQVGDVCVFVPPNRHLPILSLKVSIFRHTE